MNMIDGAPHNCAQFDDRRGGHAHDHCEVMVSVGDPFDGNEVPCNAIIEIEQDGPEYTDYLIKAGFGGFCAGCKEPTCTKHLEAGPEDDLLRCPECRSQRVNDLLQACEIDMTLVRAEQELRAYLEIIRKEPDAARIRESFKNLQGVEDAMAEIGRELFPTTPRGVLLKGAA